MDGPLSGRVIALAEGRQLEELARLVEKEGGIALRCPLVRLADAPDPAHIVAWLRDLIDEGFAYTIFLTGEGLSRLLAVAEREAMRAEVVSALGRTKLVTRGPKPVRVLKSVDLSPAIIAAHPTTEGVCAALASVALRGLRVGVQLYEETHPRLLEFLEQAGANPRPVVPYAYLPGIDDSVVTELIGRGARGDIAVFVFTSTPQVERLYDVALRQGLECELGRAFERARIAAVGPVVATSLRRRGVWVDICPEQGFVMKNLVQLIKRGLEKRPR
jgi:uroporphyrinogen-III synthase